MDAHFIFLKWTLSCPCWSSDDRPSSAGEWHGKTSHLELLPVLAGNHGLSINISGSYFQFQYLNIFLIFSLFLTLFYRMYSSHWRHSVAILFLLFCLSPLTFGGGWVWTPSNLIRYLYDLWYESLTIISRLGFDPIHIFLTENISGWRLGGAKWSQHIEQLFIYFQPCSSEPFPEFIVYSMFS